MKLVSSTIALLTLSGIVLPPAAAQTYLATAEIPSAGLMLEVRIDVGAGDLEVRTVGPADRWFAWGFGSQTMSGTYALITNETGNEIMVERKLGNHNGGQLLEPSITLISSQNDGSTLDVVVSRALEAPGPDYYEFDLQAVENMVPIDVIWARGSSLAFMSHNARGTRTVIFERETTSVPDDDTASHQDVTWGQVKLRFTKIAD